MLALKGYYDGKDVKTLGKLQAKKNQKLIITVLDEFMEETSEIKERSARGTLAKFANQELQSKEKDAWAKAVAEKYADA